MNQRIHWRWPLLIGGIALFIWGYRGTHYIRHDISGTSMSPLFSDGQSVLIKKNSTVQRYDVLAFSVVEEEGLFVKRVIGVPGDAVFLSGNRFVIDLDGTGRFVSTYSVDLSETLAKQWKGLSQIPEGRYFVLGDHLAVSKDSRSFGWVSYLRIEGQVTDRLF